MKISQCMTRDVLTVAPDQPIQEAAKLMLRGDTGSIPVCDGDHLIGMITDRDISVRAVADGRDASTPVRETMTKELTFCFEEDDVEKVAMQMSTSKVRRLPVVSRNEKELVGIVSLGDISQSSEHDLAEVALGGAAEPGKLHNQRA